MALNHTPTDKLTLEKSFPDLTMPPLGKRVLTKAPVEQSVVLAEAYS